MYREWARNAVHLASRKPATQHAFWTELVHRVNRPRKLLVANSSGWARQHRPRLRAVVIPDEAKLRWASRAPWHTRPPCSLRGSGKRLELPPGHCHIPHVALSSLLNPSDLRLLVFPFSCLSLLSAGSAVAVAVPPCALPQPRGAAAERHLNEPAAAYASSPK